MTYIKNTYYRVKTKVASKITDDRYVFKLVSPKKLDHRRIAGEVTHHFRTIDDIPDAILRKLPHSAELSERFDLGIQLTVVMVGDNFGSMGWVRLAHDFRWIVPVSHSDRLINRGHTNPKMRGRGLQGRCIVATLQEDFEGRAASGQVSCDCHINNDASTRQLLKTGAFELVARVRPLAPDRTDRIHKRLNAPRS